MTKINKVKSCLIGLKLNKEEERRLDYLVYRLRDKGVLPGMRRQDVLRHLINGKYTFEVNEEAQEAQRSAMVAAEEQASVSL